MALKIVSVLLVFLGAACVSADISCKACRALSIQASEVYTDNTTVEEFIDMFVNETCAGVQAKHEYSDCTTELPMVWPEIAKGLFSTGGWFNYKEWCQDLKCDWTQDDIEGEMGEEEGMMCSDCEGRMNASAYFYDDGVIIGEIIHVFQFLGFCNKFGEETRACQEKVAYTLPRVLRAMKNSELTKNVHKTLCVENVKCI